MLLNPRKLLFYNESSVAINQSVGASRKLLNPVVLDIVVAKQWIVLMSLLY